MSEQLLDHPEVGAALEQVGGEGVAQAVRVTDEAAQGARVEAPATRREEEGVLGSAGQLGPGVVQVAPGPGGRLLTKRNEPLLAALAAHVHGLVLEVDVGEIEPDRIGAAQTGRVNELEQGAVA